MSMHLFATPTECTQCGTVVDDPTADKCPNCGALLKERRTPSRIAGVEKRYGNVRFIVRMLRFTGIAIAMIGVLIFFFGLGEAEFFWGNALLVLAGSIFAAIAIYAVTAVFIVAIDIEENTRATFRLQQLMLDEVQGRRTPTPGAEA
jgi:hypothetical protein